MAAISALLSIEPRGFASSIRWLIRLVSGRAVLQMAFPTTEMVILIFLRIELRPLCPLVAVPGRGQNSQGTRTALRDQTTTTGPREKELQPPYTSAAYWR